MLNSNFPVSDNVILVIFITDNGVTDISIIF